MVTSGGGSEEAPHEGYYPDPSIPGYVRYWNGAAWVPGTSRPQPAAGEVLAPPPNSTPPGGSSAPPPSAPRPAVPRQPASVEESGPMFLDEDPKAPVAQTPPQGADAPGWNADPARQSGFGDDARRVSWGTPEGQRPVPLESGYGYPRTAPPATPSAPGGYGYPAEKALPAAPGGYGYPQPPGAQGPAATPGAPAPGPGAPASGDGGVPWQRQVHDLARPDASVPPAADAHALPWRPPVSDPFSQLGEPARPAGTGRRLAARLLDTLIVGAVVSAATYPLATGSLHHIQHKIDAARLSGENVQVWLIDGTTGVYLGALLGGMLLAGLLYEVLPTVKWGRTLGKKLLGIQVLDIESQLTPGFGQALRRMLLRQVLDFVVVGVANVAWCLFDRPWRQCWHDKVARTFVAAPGGDG